MIVASSINPGVLDRRVALLQCTVTRNTIGEAVQAWTATATVWARWLPQNSREFIQAQARWSELTALLRIRWRAGVLPTWRATIGGVTYRLAGVPLEVGRREYLDVPLSALNAATGYIIDEAGAGITDENGNLITDETGPVLVPSNAQLTDDEGDALTDENSNPITDQ